MRNDFIIVENVCKNDEHLITNLSFIKHFRNLHDVHRIYVLKSGIHYYRNFCEDLKVYSFFHLFSQRKIVFLTASWSVLFFQVIFRRSDILLFHNFFSFLRGNTVVSFIKRYLFRLYLNLARSKNYVLSEHIADSLKHYYSSDFYFIPLWHDIEIIQKFCTVEINLKKRIVIFGNIYPGKLDLNGVNTSEILHLGKIHGDMDLPFESLDRYLSVEEYYSYLKSAEFVLISYTDYSFIASGVVADCVSMNKKIISNDNSYVSFLVDKYNLEIYHISEFINSRKLNNLPTQGLLSEDFKNHLSQIF